MHSNPLDKNGLSEDLHEFCAHLAHGLHAMAQPLTILRSIGAASASPELTPMERLRYLDISQEQIERTCTLFEGLQDLVIAKRYKSNSVNFDLTRLVTALVTDLKSAIVSSCAELTTDLPSVPIALYGDVARTRLSITAALKVALSLGEPGDVIKLWLERREDSADLTIRRGSRSKTPLNPSQILRLALAETNIRSQGGRYDCVVDPFCVHFALPVQGATLESETALQGEPQSDTHSTSISPPDRNQLESERPL